MPISFQHLPVDIYRVIFGTGIGVFFLSLLFCCYCIRYGDTERLSKDK